MPLGWELAGQVIVELLSNELTQVEIAEEFGVSLATVGRINYGTRYHMDGFHYPIRKVPTPQKKLSVDDLDKLGPDELDYQLWEKIGKNLSAG